MCPILPECCQQYSAERNALSFICLNLIKVCYITRQDRKQLSAFTRSQRLIEMDGKTFASGSFLRLGTLKSYQE